MNHSLEQESECVTFFLLLQSFLPFKDLSSHFTSIDQLALADVHLGYVGIKNNALLGDRHRLNSFKY